MIFLLTLAIVVASIAGLSAGVLLGRAPVRGGCGQLSGSGCDGCERRRTEGKEARD